MKAWQPFCVNAANVQVMVCCKVNPYPLNPNWMNLSFPNIGSHSDRLSARLQVEHKTRQTCFARIKETGTGYTCPNEKCIRGFLTRRGLREHLAKNECQTGIQRFRKATSPMPTDRQSGGSIGLHKKNCRQNPREHHTRVNWRHDWSFLLWWQGIWTIPYDCECTLFW